MGVPDTSTFSLQDVVDVLDPSTNDLVACFAVAEDGGFDTDYKGDKDRLSNFRNYEPITFTASITVEWITGPNFTNFGWSISNTTGDSRRYYYRGQVYTPNGFSEGNVLISGNQSTGGSFQISTASKPTSFKFWVKDGSNAFTDDDIIDQGAIPG